MGYVGVAAGAVVLGLVWLYRCDVAVNPRTGRITIMDLDGNVTVLGYTPDRHVPGKRGAVAQHQLSAADTWAS